MYAKTCGVLMLILGLIIFLIGTILVSINPEADIGGFLICRGAILILIGFGILVIHAMCEYDKLNQFQRWHHG